MSVEVIIVSQTCDFCDTVYIKHFTKIIFLVKKNMARYLNCDALTERHMLLPSLVLAVS